MNKEDKLKSYQPEYWRGITEMDAILETEGTEFDDVVAERTRTFDNLFIETADVDGVIRWETILSIIPGLSATLEERKSVILSFLRGVEKLSGTSIQNIAIAYTNGETTVTFDSPNSLIVVEFTSIIGTPPNFSDLEAYLNTRKPAHLGISYVFLFNTHADLSAFTHAQLAAYTQQQLRDTEIV